MSKILRIVGFFSVYFAKKSRIPAITGRDVVRGQFVYCVINALCDDSEEGLSYTRDFTHSCASFFGSVTIRVLRNFHAVEPNKVGRGKN